MAMKTITTTECFGELVKETKQMEGYREPIAFGIARVDRGQENAENILQASFPVVNWRENFDSAAVFVKALQEAGVKVDFSGNEFVADITEKFVDNCANAFNLFWAEAAGDKHKNVQVINYLAGHVVFNGELKIDDNIAKQVADGEFKIVFLFEDAAPQSVEAVYLKLYALSLGKAPLRSLNLDGAFGILPNVAWSGNYPVELDWLRENEIPLKMSGEYPIIDFVDKFPRYLQHIIPADNTRILDTAKVRMGGQLAAGTTQMPGAAYINFNAGTVNRRNGESNKGVMDEGRISSSAIVGDGTDIGGGASILGVLSGTDGIPVSVGEDCLLGANSACGISLGDGCIIDAGVSVLAGTKIKIIPGELEKIKVVNPDFDMYYRIGRKHQTAKYEKAGDDFIFKAEELQGLNGVHYRQNSLTGEMNAMRSTREVKLNSELH